MATKKFTREELPVGSIIEITVGWQYRPEGWTSLSSTNTSSTRPPLVSTQVVEVTEEWWGSFNYRAFNLAYSDGKTDVTAADAVHLQIYIPKN